MKKPILVYILFSFLLVVSCNSDNSSDTDDEMGVVDDDMMDNGGGDTDAVSTPLSAFDEFDDSVTITFSNDGTEVTISTDTSQPEHMSPYWSNTTARVTNDQMAIPTEAADENHPLFVEPTVTSYTDMSAGNIDDREVERSFTVTLSPELASSSTATDLDAIGISVSGVPIFNDEEGANVALDAAAGSLDFAGAHMGPSAYHYHLEPKPISDDDTNLIGIIADGFLLYGRGSHENNGHELDEFNGHVGTTQHSEEAHYHYHIDEDTEAQITVNGILYYILFPNDYAGTPVTINQ